ncbi:TonB-dependent receptor [uncultured Algibacter sp.]|uniref:TonB-dependent receptor n=1 Tax=uncultured Algibacter sp. TaxID=298659 RepID=UPI002618F645|nr:TonB-dependent receptor [uncultured Algibacter sp.]
MNSITKNGFLLIIMLLSVSIVAAQSISGNVKDQAGIPLAGVNVILDGTSKGAVTDFDGNYTISSIENGTYTLSATFLGYAKVSQNITINDADVTVNFTMAEDAQSLDVIVVTGVVNPKSRLESSVSVSSIGIQQIAQSAPRTSGEVFRNIPAIRAETSGGDGNGNYSVRGVPVSSGGSRYLQIQEDGLPINLFGDTSFGNSDNWLRIDSNIGRVESIRGGSASTQTSNGPAGIINVISKTGATEGGSVSTTFGLDYQTNRIDFEYGTPLANGISYHIGGFMRSGEGPKAAGYNANQGGQLKANFTKRFNSGYIRTYFKFLNDRSAMYLPGPTLVEGSDSDPTFTDLPGYDINNDSQHSAFLQENAGVSALDGNRRTGDIRTGNNPIVKAIGLEFSFDLGDGWKVFNKGRTASRTGEWAGPFTAGFGATADIEAEVRGYIPATATGGLVYADGAREAYNPDNGLLQILHMFDVTIEDMGSFVNDFKISKKLGDNVSATAGYFFASQKTKTGWNWTSFLSEVKGDNARLVDIDGFSRGGQFAYGNPKWGNCCNNKYNTVHTINSPYLGIDAKITENLNFDGSIRFENVDVDGTIASFGSAAPQNYDVNGNGVIEDIETSVPVRNPNQNQIVNDEYNFVSFSAGLNYKLNDDSAVFGRYSRGASGRAPDRNSYGLDGTAATQYDQISQLEVGYKRKINNGYINLVAFLSNTDEDAGAALNQTVGNEFKASGLELEGLYNPGSFSIVGSITYTNAEITEDRASGTGANTGNTPQRQADFVYNFSPRYTFGKDRQHSLGLGIIGTSKSFASDGNALIMPGYTYVNLLGTVALTKGLSVSINVNNLFDTVGITEIDNGGSTIGDAPGGNRYALTRGITGRSSALSLAYKF